MSETQAEIKPGDKVYVAGRVGDRIDVCGSMPIDMKGGGTSNRTSRTGVDPSTVIPASEVEANRALAAMVNPDIADRAKTKEDIRVVIDRLHPHAMPHENSRAVLDIISVIYRHPDEPEAAEVRTCLNCSSQRRCLSNDHGMREQNPACWTPPPKEPTEPGPPAAPGWEDSPKVDGYYSWAGGSIIGYRYIYADLWDGSKEPRGSRYYGPVPPDTLPEKPKGKLTEEAARGLRTWARLKYWSEKSIAQILTELRRWAASGDLTEPAGMPVLEPEPSEDTRQ